MYKIAAMHLAQSWWQLGQYSIGTHVAVVFMWEEGCGRQNNMFRQLTMRPVLTINESGVGEFEIAKGVVILTPSVTHLVGLP